MRTAITGLILLLLFASPSWAETVYVDDLHEVMMRTGPDAKNRIVSVVKSGKALDALESKGGWTKVRAPWGKEGWIISRYLTDTEPPSVAFSRLEAAYKGTAAKVEGLAAENARLKEENQALAEGLDQAKALAEEKTTAYNTLEEESREFFEVKNALSKAQAEAAAQKARAEEAEGALASLQKSRGYIWMGTGAGILFLGVILGMILKPRRRRSSLGF